MFSSRSASSSSGVSLDDRLPVTSFSESLPSTPRSSTGSDQSFFSTSHHHVTTQKAGNTRNFFERNRPVASKKRWRNQQSLTLLNRSSTDGEKDPVGRRNSHELNATASIIALSSGFPAGFGGWNASKLYDTRVDHDERKGNTTMDQRLIIQPSETVSVTSSSAGYQSANDVGPDPETERRNNQIHAYINWVNAQLKKKPGRQCITDLTNDMKDGTAFADLIEVVSNEKLDGILLSPTTKMEMVANVEKVIAFMVAKNIRMHETSAKDIVYGNLNSTMRLVLALAAHYKPNSVRESRSTACSSFASYAQSAAVKLSDARRDAATVVPRPRPPLPLTADRNTSSSAPQSLPKSVSQDFTASQSEARYRALAENYAILNQDHQNLKKKYALISETHEDVLAQTKLLKKTVLILQQLLIEAEVNDNEHPCKIEESSVQSSGRGVSADEVSLLCSRLLHSEETRKDIKEELSKMRNDCLKRQGAEVGLQQLVDDQQNILRQYQSDLMKANLANRLLENTGIDLEAKLVEKDKEVSRLNQMVEVLKTIKKERYSERSDHQNHYHGKDHELQSPAVKVAATPSDLLGQAATKLVCYHGQNCASNTFVINKRTEDVTLLDVQLATGRSGSSYRYHFQMHDAVHGLVKRVVTSVESVVPSHEGVITSWIEDEV